jgi:hypothetical protein
MTSFAKVVKTIVENSIDQDYIDECGNPGTGAATLKSIYQAEYGYNGKSPKACMDYLQGLPSVCTVPFENYKILELLDPHETLTTQEKQYKLINDYWIEAGHQFYQLIK